MVRFDPRLRAVRRGSDAALLRAAGRARAGGARRPERGASRRTLRSALDNFDRVAFVPDGFQMPRDRESFTSAMDTVDEGFFETMGIPILRGRGFLASDTADAPRVAVVNEQFAKHYWPGADAVGKRIRLDSATGTPVEIVGVAPTIKYRDGPERPTDFVYLPLAQHPVARMVLLLRSSGDPLQLVEPVKEIVRTLDPNLPMLETRTYEDLYRYHAVDGPRVAIELVGTLGAVGLLLAIAGLYGLVAYNVSRRTREIGIRMAIGARPVRRAAPGDGQGPRAGGNRNGDRAGDGLRRRAAHEFHAVQRRRSRRGGLSRRRAVDGARSPCWRPTCPRAEHPGLRRRWRCDTSKSQRPDRRARLAPSPAPGP